MEILLLYIHAIGLIIRIGLFESTAIQFGMDQMTIQMNSVHSFTGTTGAVMWDNYW